MGIFSFLDFKGKRKARLMAQAQEIMDAPVSPMVEVNCRYVYGNDLSRLVELEEKLVHAIGGGDLGVYDGNVVSADGSGDISLYFYGDDVDGILEAIRPVLIAADVIERIAVSLVYGSSGDNVNEKVVEIGFSSKKSPRDRG